jgi:eukaryotic-like serine/threonine-protein kinase
VTISRGGFPFPCDTAPAVTATGCLDDTSAAALLEVSLPEAERDRIEQHLDDCAACRTLVSHLVRARPARPSADRSPSLAEPLLGRYHITGLCGVGSMGVVFASHDAQLHREVALKLVRSSGSPERLIREARALAQLDHPNVVAVHDAGADGERVFVAMDLIRGVTLTRWLEVERPVRVVLEHLVQAARGLAAAHAAGLIHRDVKPDNILVGEDGRVRITDFGLARAAAGEEPASATLIGTPAYMAPEQLRGEPATAASDQFAFCVTLHEALHGARPFAGTTIRELAASIASGPVAARRRVPRVVTRAIARGVRGAPGERHGAMAEVVAQLERALRPVRGRGIVAAAVVAVAAVAGTLVVASATALLARGAAVLQWPALERALDRRAGDWAAMQGEVCAATQAAPILEQRQDCLDDRARELAIWLGAFDGTTPPDARRVLEAAEALPAIDQCRLPARRDGRAVPATVATSMLDAELAALAAGLVTVRPAAAVPVAARAVASARTLGDRYREARALLLHGELLLDAGDAAGAEPILFAAFTTANEVGADYVAAQAGIQEVFLQGWRLGKQGEARRWIDLTRAITVRLDSAELGATLDASEGSLAVSWGQYDDGIAKLGRALATHERLRGPHSYAVLRDRLNLVQGHLERGEFPRAEREAREVLALALVVVGEWHNATAQAVQLAGDAVTRQGRLAEARALLERGIAIREVVLPADHPSIAESHAALANVLVYLGEPARALVLIDKAITITERRQAPNHLQVAMWLFMRGNAQLELGKPDDALASYRRAERIARDLPNPEIRAIPLLGIGQLELAAGRLREARAALEQAVALFEAPPRSNPPGLQSARFELGKTLWELGERARGRAMVEGVRAPLKELGADEQDLAELDGWLRTHPSVQK